MRNGIKALSAKTPYDNIWSWLAFATVGFATTAFLFLRSGSLSLFPTPDALTQDDAMVRVAFWGATICSTGLLGLGAIALRYAGSQYVLLGPPWPRLGKIETDVRDPFVARLGLIGTILPTLISIAACLYTYITKSRISLWDETIPLASGFLSSRMAALRHDCLVNPCFRVHFRVNEGAFAHEWFWFNDVLLLVLLFGCIAVWSLYLLRVNGMTKNS